MDRGDGHPTAARRPRARAKADRRSPTTPGQQRHRDEHGTDDDRRRHRQHGRHGRRRHERQTRPTGAATAGDTSGDTGTDAPATAAAAPRRRRRLGAAGTDAARDRRRRRGPRRRRQPAGSGPAGYARATAQRRAAGRETIAAVRLAEAPRQLDGLGDPDPRPGDDRAARAPGGRGGSSAIGPVEQVGAVELEVDAQRLGQLARARAELLDALAAAARAHQLDALERLERPDQHRRADALGLADGVEQRVDAVGAVHVGDARRPEQRPACAA